MVVVAVGTGREPRLVELLAFVSWKLAGLVVFVSPDEDAFPSLSSFRLELNNVERSEEVAMEEEVAVVGSCTFWADWIPNAKLFCAGVETSM